jgi:hypothetical protein
LLALKAVRGAGLFESLHALPFVRIMLLHLRELSLRDSRRGSPPFGVPLVELLTCCCHGGGMLLLAKQAAKTRRRRRLIEDRLLRSRDKRRWWQRLLEVCTWEGRILDDRP